MENKLTSYEKVQMARSADRPDIMTYIDELFDDFIEMHGDRLYRDDPAIVGGICMFHERPVTVIGHRKGKNTEDNIRYNFGMASPEGYRKARRLMEQAQKFKRPVITFVDTPGAYPGIEAENNGQSNAIAENLAFMSRITVPVITVVTGEGSSGGALAIALSDRVYMLENAVYAILSPEGYASILWKDAKRASEASDLMKLTAQELKEFGLIDGIIPEGRSLMTAMDRMLRHELTELSKLGEKALVQRRYQKFRRMGKAE